MKHNHGTLTRLFALCLTLMLAMSLASFAAAEDSTTGPKAVTLDKYLVMSTTANVPNATFTFTVTKGTAVPANAANGTPEIKEGIGPMPTVPDAKFVIGQQTYDTVQGSDTVTLIDDRKYAKQELTIDMSGITFTEPGVYRYVITENASDVDGVKNDTNTKRYLDVYVGSSGLGLAIQGTVLHPSDAVVKADGTVKYDPKDEGFQNDYIAYDLQINKTVDGNQAFRSKLYKFTVTISGAAKGTKFNVEGTGALNTAPEGETAASTSPLVMPETGDLVATFYLKHNQYVIINGLTAKTSYTVAEKDYATEGYKTTFTQTDVTAPTTHTPSTTKKEMGEKDNSVTFYNYRAGEVPTGILLDIWPYILIVVVAAVALVLLMSRRRKHNADE